MKYRGVLEDQKFLGGSLIAFLMLYQGSFVVYTFCIRS